LAEAGANTLAVYQGDDKSAEVSLWERESAGPGRHSNVKADIGDEVQIERLIGQSRAEFADGLDFLVLNAGIGLRGTVADTEPHQWRRLLNVNLGSTFLLTRGLIPALKTGGSIVAIGSGAGHDTIPGLAFYGATKAAINLFIADLAQEVGPRGIRANVVSPGSTDNSFQENAPAPSIPQSDDLPNALRRRGVPDDVAGAVLFLCSDLSGFVTGQALRVNGGAI
jgi:3-oxoacyl-[acyl-carrier protein] reductase